MIDVLIHYACIFDKIHFVECSLQPIRLILFLLISETKKKRNGVPSLLIALQQPPCNIYPFCIEKCCIPNAKRVAHIRFAVLESVSYLVTLLRITRAFPFSFRWTHIPAHPIVSHHNKTPSNKPPCKVT